jgi:hypothetical protein
MNRWRVGEDIGSKEMDRCPLTMTCNGKAVSKVMGWGMILSMIRDKEVT